MAPWLEEAELDVGEQAEKMQTDAWVRPPHHTLLRLLLLRHGIGVVFLAPWRTWQQRLTRRRGAEEKVVVLAPWRSGRRAAPAVLASSSSSSSPRTQASSAATSFRRLFLVQDMQVVVSLVIKVYACEGVDFAHIWM